MMLKVILSAFTLLSAHTLCGIHADNDVVLYDERDDNKGSTKELDRRKEIEYDIDTNDYIAKLFLLYGNKETMQMNMSGFNKMLDGLGLHKLVEGGKVEVDSKQYIYNQEDKSKGVVDCIPSNDLIETVNTRLKAHSHEHEHHDHGLSSDTQTIITSKTLQAVCPILLYQKLANTSIERSGCLKIPLHHHKHGEKKNAYLTNTAAVWLYSTISIIAISACGLFGVAVIPIMHKSYYNHILQFLVALAVGTLCGDALLHLMPHALSPIDEHTLPDHDDGMWKGLAAMLGVVLFYFTEKGLTVIVEWRKRRQKLEDNLPHRVRVVKDGATPKTNSFLKLFRKDDKQDPTTKTCKHKYSEYPYCYDEIESDTHNEHHLRDGQKPDKPLSIVSNNVEGKEDQASKEKLLNDGVVEMNSIKIKEDAADVKESDSYTVILREHSRAHHGHSHSHGHVHAPPSSMSSVAWMVIMGDGLHNFTDGMAIGAAFASNIAGGFSTAIAVLCHELPHELGDFAVLLKAGMSVRRAVCYNLLSSLLCLMGMVCGVLAGNAPSATRWLFAVAAGTFLYIALVDMMPELSTSHSKEGTVCQCILQFLGLATGVGVMLVIALYEHDLKTLFG